MLLQSVLILYISVLDMMVVMLNVKLIIVSKMTSHCTHDTVQMREEFERGIRK